MDKIYFKIYSDFRFSMDPLLKAYDYLMEKSRKRFNEMRDYLTRE